MSSRLLILKCYYGSVAGSNNCRLWMAPTNRWQVVRGFLREQSLFTVALDVYILRASFSFSQAAQLIP